MLIDIPSEIFPRDGSVIEDMTNFAPAKFIVSKESDPKLLLFPAWCKHMLIVKKKIADLGIREYYGAGRVELLHNEPLILPEQVRAKFDSPTFVETFGFDRPADESLQQRLLTETHALIADVFNSILKRRQENEWPGREHSPRSA